MANTKEEIKEQYQKEAATYKDTVRLVNFDLDILFPLYLNILNTLYQDHNAPINILDIGAGSGLLTELVLSSYPNAHITLLDFSEEMLNSAKRSFSNNPNIKYLKEDFIEGQLPKEEFDLVISSYAIHHTRNE